MAGSMRAASSALAPQPAAVTQSAASMAVVIHCFMCLPPAFFFKSPALLRLRGLRGDVILVILVGARDQIGIQGLHVRSAQQVLERLHALLAQFRRALEHDG